MSSKTRSTPAPLRLGKIADHLKLQLHGDPDRVVDSVSTLSCAGPRQISFLANPAYRDQLRASAAGAVILEPRFLADCVGNCSANRSANRLANRPVTALVAEDAYLAWARLLEWWHPPPAPRPGIHSSTVVAESAQVDRSAEIGPLCHIGEHVRIGPECIVGPGCLVSEGSVVGEGCRLTARVYLGPGCHLGRRVLIYPGAVIGADGFGLAMDGDQWRKVAQIGSVRIGDDCEIGANTTIDRGAIEDTELGCDVRVDNQVQIAHNVRIGDHSAIAGCVGIAGSTRIGRYCMIAGASGIGGHLEICDHVTITAMSTVLDSIDRPGRYGSAIPARPLRTWQKILVRLGRLGRPTRQTRGTTSDSGASGT